MGRICFVAHIELEFVPREEDDRSSVYGQEQPGDSVPWTDEARSLVLGPKKAQDISRENNGSVPLPSGSNLWKLAVSLFERVDGPRTSWGRGSRVR